MKALHVIAFCVLLSAALAPAVVAQERPYNNSSGNVTHANWTDNHSDVTLENVSHYISRVGAFVVGEDPGDPGAGPFFTGLLVAGFGLLVLGGSRAGLVASGTMGVIVVAGLSAPLGAGLMPRWLYGTAVLLVAFVAGVLYIRLLR